MGKHILNLEDQVFGDLIVIDKVMDPAKKIPGHTTWYCMCGCGEFRYATSFELQTRGVKTCVKCASKQTGKKRVDIAGTRVGKLTVLRPSPNQGHRTAWLCKCDCGNHREVITSVLRQGKATSCGYCGPNPVRNKPKRVYDANMRKIS